MRNQFRITDLSVAALRARPDVTIVYCPTDRTTTYSRGDIVVVAQGGTLTRNGKRITPKQAAKALSLSTTT